MKRGSGVKHANKYNIQRAPAKKRFILNKYLILIFLPGVTPFSFPGNEPKTSEI